MAIANIIFSSMTKIIKVRNKLLVSKTGSNMTKLMRVSKFTKRFREVPQAIVFQACATQSKSEFKEPTQF